MEKTYKIVRFFRNPISGIYPKLTIKHGLTLQEAQEWCSDPETSSTTCTSAEGTKRTEKHGPWFDGYDEEN